MKRIGIVMLIVFACATSLDLAAQALYVGENQELWVSGGAILSVNTHMENRGELTNQGEIAVSGNWLNQGTYLPSTGTLRLTAANSQQFDHGGQSVYRLLLENGGDKLLLSDVTVLDSLALYDGIMRAENNALVNLNVNASASEGHANSYIEGAFVNTGTGYKHFPIGKNNMFHPIELLDVQGQNPVIRAEVNLPHPEARSLSNLERASTTRYWQVNTLSGNYEGSVVRLAVTDEPDFESEDGVVVVAAAGFSSEYENLGVSEFLGQISNGTITSEQATNLSVIALGLSAEYSVRGRVLVPNAFAPASPVIEDQRLSIFAVDLSPDNFVFRIFNRWGKMVYETTSVDEAVESGWDGINQETNQPAQFGVYSYYLSGRFSNDEIITQKGTLTLFR